MYSWNLLNQYHKLSHTEGNLIPKEQKEFQIIFPQNRISQSGFLDSDKL